MKIVEIDAASARHDLHSFLFASLSFAALSILSVSCAALRIRETSSIIGAAWASVPFSKGIAIIIEMFEIAL